MELGNKSRGKQFCTTFLRKNLNYHFFFVLQTRFNILLYNLKNCPSRKSWFQLEIDIHQNNARLGKINTYYVDHKIIYARVRKFMWQRRRIFARISFRRSVFFSLLKNRFLVQIRENSSAIARENEGFFLFNRHFAPNIISFPCWGKRDV